MLRRGHPREGVVNIVDTSLGNDKEDELAPKRAKRARFWYLQIGSDAAAGPERPRIIQRVEEPQASRTQPAGNGRGAELPR